MSFRIRPGRPCGDEIRRVFAERLQLALAHFAAYPEADPEGLHESRKNLKRLRSVLRLLRADGFARTRRSLNASLREVARSLSRDRDHEVLAQLLARWHVSRATAGDPLLRRDCGELAAALAARGARHRGLDPALRRAVAHRITAIGARFEGSQPGSITRKTLGAAFRRSGKRMAAAGAAFRAAPETATFHEWRKRLKDHLYHRQLLGKLLDLKASGTRRLGRLEVILGEVRDCDLLIGKLRLKTRLGATAAQARRLAALARLEKARLLHEAMRFAAR